MVDGFGDSTESSVAVVAPSLPVVVVDEFDVDAVVSGVVADVPVGVGDPVVGVDASVVRVVGRAVVSGGVVVDREVVVDGEVVVESGAVTSTVEAPLTPTIARSPNAVSSVRTPA